MSENELLEFPCAFPIKVMGAADVNLERLVTDILGRHVSDLDAAAVTSRPSRHGKYVAVTAVITGFR